MITHIVMGIVFLAVFLAIMAANAILVELREASQRSQRNQENIRKRDEWRESARAQMRTPDFSEITREVQADEAVEMSFGRRCAIWLEQSGLQITPARLTRYSALSAAIGGVLGGCVGILTADQTAVILTASCGALVGTLLPVAYVMFQRSLRIARISRQLPSAFDLMARVLRAGQTVSQSMHAVADEFPEPLGMEFMICAEQIIMGLNFEQALRELGQRTAVVEMRIFTVAIVVHSQTGGNLAILLDKLAHVVRERYRIQGMIQSLTAQGRFQATILLSLPPFMFVVLFMLQPEYESILLGYPLLIATAAGMMALGASWIRKIIHFDY